MSSNLPNWLAVSEFGRKAQINIRLSDFEIPPMQDILLIGKKAPIGPEAVRRMVEAMSPEQYDIIFLDHKIFEAIVIKKSLLKQISKEKLLPIILEEGELIATEETVIKAQVNITFEINRGIVL
ncbi:MAG TPA: hypothetical protein DDW65_06865 [Firmicutes bacterium]|jgi:hypothetical protein|nr:hypothetical protein [Bacillota bacterium]